MSATNHTPNLELSQIVATDKPGWLTDYNSDMEKIDTGFGEVQTKEEANTTAIENLQASFTTLAADVSKNVTDIANNSSEITLAKNNITQLSTGLAGVQEDVQDLETNIDTATNEQWIIMDASNGVGIKDGTWHTSYIGYAMDSLGKVEGTDFFAGAESGMGLVAVGSGGHTFLTFLQQVILPQIQNKNKIKKLFCNLLVNIAGNTVEQVTNALTAFTSYVKSQFPECQIEYFSATRGWTPIPNSDFIKDMVYTMNNLGIVTHLDTVVANRNRLWFQADGVHLNDEGQHATGQKMVNMFKGMEINYPFKLRTLDHTTFVMNDGWQILADGQFLYITESAWDNDKVIPYLGFTVVNPSEKVLGNNNANKTKLFNNPFNLINNRFYGGLIGKPNIMVWVGTMDNMINGIMDISDEDGVCIYTYSMPQVTVPANTPVVIRLLDQRVMYPYI